MSINPNRNNSGLIGASLLKDSNLISGRGFDQVISESKRKKRAYMGSINE
jgi:hypothetical protein